MTFSIVIIIIGLALFCIMLKLTAEFEKIKSKVEGLRQVGEMRDRYISDIHITLDDHERQTRAIREDIDDIPRRIPIIIEKEVLTHRPFVGYETHPVFGGKPTMMCLQTLLERIKRIEHSDLFYTAELNKKLHKLKSQENEIEKELKSLKKEKK